MKYYLGLDMGTASLGWAVTDENYRLLRAKGKDLWGVRLFKEAKTAAERRTHRTNRRRLQRERVRIGYLKEIFAEEIQKRDSGFYQRLEDSKYHKEDKQCPFALFADTGYTDKEYYEQYPTIFHLRKELLESQEPHDVRLVFLAVLNMFKHRGHFLNANLSDEGIGSIQELYGELAEKTEAFVQITEISKIEEILSSKTYSNSIRYEKMQEILNIDKKKPEVQMLKWICGLKGTLVKAFPSENYEEEVKEIKFTFRDGKFEETLAEAEKILSEENYEILLVLKQIHDWGLLANLMKGEHKTYQYLSCARVDQYEKHHTDLRVLQKVYKRYFPEKYTEMFRVMKADNYSAYVGSVQAKGKKIRRGAKCNTEDFFEKIKNAVKNIPNDEDVSYILQEIEKGTFLPKQLTSSNGIIPNQVHKTELKKILNNAETYLPFLKEKDETGFTNSEKIVKLFEFQIPYYVGPLYNDEKHTAWSVRKQQGAVLPWNFEQKINVKASAEEFIKKMVNHCTYLNSETVLPKNSLLYEKFMVLNELNNLRINGEKISVELKQKLYQELFTTGKAVTGKKIKDFLKKQGLVEKNSEIDITGIDGDFKNTLANYAKFKSIFHTEILTYEQETMAEQIIFWATVYGDSKAFLRERIQEEYGTQISEEQIKRICGMKFKDWGRLSRKLLLTQGADKATGEVKTILSRMWDENYNFMQLFSTAFTYREEIEEQALQLEKTLTEMQYEDLKELYLSAPVKRMVWQTIQVMKEIYQVLGEEPAKIFIEMARAEEEKKERKDSRKKKFAELYKNCKEEDREWSKEIADTDEKMFRSKKLYLYYTQKGRCMYTGERIELADLFQDNLYDIDHIYPRHFVKDDSIENNLVLVKKEKNNEKKDIYPLHYSIRQKCCGMWKALADGGFITKEKWNRLTRTDEFTAEEQAAFINRQLVETRQGTKVIAGLFEKTFQNSEVVYVKAGNVSRFRTKYDCEKCRNVNDFHHATDAYLNIVVGNTYFVKFTKDPLQFVKEYRRNPEQNKYHMEHLFDYNVRRNGETAWKADNKESITLVKKMLAKNTPLVTMMNYEAHGGLADQNIYSAEKAEKAKGKGKEYLPIKTSDKILADTTKYGGYNSLTGSYFFLVEHTEKKKRVRTLEPMPLYRKEELNSIEKIEEYCRQELKYQEPSVRLSKIKMYSLIKVDGFYLYLTGRSGTSLLVANAVQLVLGYQDMKYIKKLQAVETLSEEQLEKETEISKERNLKLYETLIQKHCNAIYSKRPNSVGKRLQAGKQRFETLSISKQIYVLLQILQLSQTANKVVNLTLIGGSSKAGKSGVHKRISDKTEFILINQSPAGLYESQVDLLTV